MASILHQIATPLQLVALFLLLTAGLARILVRSGSWKDQPDLARLVISRVFYAAILALVLGVGAPTVAPLLERALESKDESFHGSVLSDSGTGVTGATVTIVSLATVTTNSLGQFDATIPRNRTLKEYRIQVTAPGFRTPGEFVRTDAQMRTLDIRLTPEPVRLVRDLASNVAIGQFYGMPVALLNFRVENAGTAITTITDVRASLTGPGTSLTLVPLVWTILGPLGPFEPVEGQIPVFAGAKLDLRIVMGTGTDLPGLMQRLNGLPEYRTQPPCFPGVGGAKPLTEAAFGIVKRFFDDRFALRPGDWRLKVDITGDNIGQSYTREFSLSDADIASLRQSVSLTRQCRAISFDRPFAQDGNVANFVSK